MKTEIDTLAQRLKISEKAEQINKMEQDASQPNFWDNPEDAQKLMQKMSKLKSSS